MKKVSKKKKVGAKAPKKASRVSSGATVGALIGAKIAGFKLPSTGGGNMSLNDLKGKTVVLYFYPRDATPGCTLQGQEFSKLIPNFKKIGAEVFGISRDTLASHEKFKSVQKYAMELLSDGDEKVCGLFGVIKMKNMYGKKVRGIERSTFVIGSDGRLIKEWRGVRVPGHAQEVLEFVKSL